MNGLVPFPPSHRIPGLLPQKSGPLRMGVPSRGRVLLAVGALLSISTGCGERSGTQPTVTRTDSAGIVIVENTGLPPAGGGEWEIGPEPSLSIGTVEGDDAYQFFAIAGAHRLQDGRIAVIDAGSREIRIYSPEGRHLVSFGGRGAGPNEFELPILAGTLGDTMLVVDRGQHRLSIVHPGLGFVGGARISDEVGGFLNPLGGFANGETVYGGAFDMRRIGELRDGLNRSHTFYRSSRLDGSLAADFGDMEGADFYIEDLDGEGRASQPALIPFGRVPTAAVSPNYFFFSPQNEFDIQAFHPSGRLVRRIRLGRSPIPVTAFHGEQYIEEIASQVESSGQDAEIRAYLRTLPLPRFFPPHGRLMADVLDCLWVEDFQPPGNETRIWSVFDETGALAGRVTLPDSFDPMEIGPDYVLGVGRDQLDVEYLRLYSLHRGE